MQDIKAILQKRVSKVKKHYTALKEYKILIDEMLTEKDLYDQFVFNTLRPQERAILDAYLKRFSSAVCSTQTIQMSFLLSTPITGVTCNPLLIGS